LDEKVSSKLICFPCSISGWRDRWYKFEAEASEDNERREASPSCVSNAGSNRREITSVTEDNFEAAIVEAKRKGVARVEAFLVS
jgi:hypothetical protein